MNGLDKTNRWLTLLANVSVLAGIIFLARELQQSNQFAAAEQDRSRIETTITHRNMVIDNIGVWSRGLDGEELSDSDQYIFDYLLRNQWGHIFVQTQSRERFAQSRRTGLRDFATFLYQNPAARERWMTLMEVEQASRRELGSNSGVDLMDAVIQYLEILDRSGLVLPDANIL